MEKQVSIRQWLENYKAGKYDAKDVHTQIEAGWYDWFCSDKALAGKTRTLAGKLKSILGSKKFDIEKTYVFFKNNCPCVGKLYDDFRICKMDDKDDGRPLFTITPSCGHNSNLGVSEVWGQENDFQGPLVKGTWEDVKHWFKGVKVYVGKCMTAPAGLEDKFVIGVDYALLERRGNEVLIEDNECKQHWLSQENFEIRLIVSSKTY
jgi:hypothetical protein